MRIYHEVQFFLLNYQQNESLQKNNDNHKNRLASKERINRKY